MNYIRFTITISLALFGEVTCSNPETTNNILSASAQQAFNRLEQKFDTAKKEYLDLILKVNNSNVKLMKEISVNRSKNNFLSLQDLATFLDRRNEYKTQLARSVRNLNEGMKRNITFNPRNPNDTDAESDYKFIQEFSANTETLKLDLEKLLKTPINDIYTPRRTSNKTDCVIS